MKKVLIGFSIFVGLIFLSFIIFIINFLLPINRFENKRIVIKKGQTFTEVYKDLKIDYTVVDKIYFKLTGQGSQIKVGNYNFNGKMSKYEIVNRITTSAIDGIKLTIPEGFTQSQVIDRMVALGIGSKEQIIEILKKKSFAYPHKDGNFEGYFYPDTYTFNKGILPEDAIDRVLDAFLEHYPASKYPNKEEFYKNLILASIVEKEVSNEEDKAKVAGVFLKRLQIGMRLESDATIKYALGRPATKEELKSSMSPFNSYRVTGLPPTPIGSPALSTFKAVMKPEITGDLFFFMYKDITYYSKTHEEHLQKRRETGQLK